MKASQNSGTSLRVSLVYGRPFFGIFIAVQLFYGNARTKAYPGLIGCAWSPVSNSQGHVQCRGLGLGFKRSIGGTLYQMILQGTQDGDVTYSGPCSRLLGLWLMLCLEGLGMSLAL